MRRKTSIGVAKFIGLSTETICGGAVVRKTSMPLGVNLRNILHKTTRMTMTTRSMPV